jgi:glucosamine--fructose-6-phosphate aminotransferase (isomerizing)
MSKENCLTSLMREEALEAPRAVARLLAAADPYQALGAALRAAPPTSVVTIARGSSDHASAYLGYLIMAHLGKLVTSLPMSLVTLYEPKIDARNLLSIALSQSGRSPDLVIPTEAFRRGGARTVALVNDAASPLALAAEWVFPLHAGEERSVAATKSFICQLVSGARLLAEWSNSVTLGNQLAELPDLLADAAQADWSPAVDVLKDADKLFVIGRGTCLPVALEAALKFKETCGIQAEAFSAAEVKHGPMALVDADYPLLVFAPRGPTQASLIALAEEMRGRSRKVLLAAPAGIKGADLPLVETGSDVLNPIAAIQSFYPMVEALSRARGFNPDAPPHLNKVTLTK